MSKRDDDSGVHSTSDMEAGMTTAERRRRRRRGGGLRVPSDNVPRRSTTPPVVAPVPEDPSLAMSIAYSFTSDASEPVQRMAAGDDVPSFDPVAPEAMSTVIDPPSAPVESQDFEMKTREMSAVDLEALGLTEPGSSASTRTSQPQIAVPRVAVEPSPRTVEVDVDMGGFDGGSTLDSSSRSRLGTEPSFDPPPAGPAKVMGAVRAGTEPGEQPHPPPPPPVAARVTRERLKTMALSEDDLEEVREAYRAATATPPAGQPVVAPVPAPAATPQSISSTQPLTALDVEVEDKPQSLAEIDINELAERADSSGEFEVDVEDVPLKAVPQAVAVTPPPPPPSPDRKRPPSVPPPVAKSEPHPPSVPPPFTAKEPPKVESPATITPPPPPEKAKDHHPKDHHAPPPPPKAPPKVKSSPPAASSTQSKIEGKGARGKPWFVDLFDEDYLRTLPFLTPQATQSEAEFVIEAMGLQPGAQVLDIGCGYGRHAMELAARGFHVVGLDLSTPLLVRGGEEAMRRGLEINFVRGDMRELDFDAQFDGAYCLFSTFGYFDDETNKKTVSNIARALKPGGRVMIEILNRDYVIADLPTRVWWEGEGCVVLEEVELNYFSSRIQVNRSVVFDDGRQLEQEISVRAYSLHEVGKLMHAAGFRVLEVSGGYHTRGRFFGNQSRHIIVLAERKEGTAT